MSIVVFEHSDLSGSGLLGRVLRDHGHRLRVIELHHGDAIPVDLDNVDGVISCGGGAAPDDDSQPWLNDELRFLAMAHEAKLPMVGLCLGSQLLARALGGSVQRMKQPEVGFVPVTLTPASHMDAILAGVGWTTMQPQWHSYEVVKLPDGAKRLAQSARCDIQAWMHGIHTYAFQHHPEIVADDMLAWADDEPDMLKEAGLSRETLKEQITAHMDTSIRLGLRLFRNIAECLMPVDRRYAGAGHDIHV